jgi:hypothetical protein
MHGWLPPADKVSDSSNQANAKMIFHPKRLAVSWKSISLGENSRANFEPSRKRESYR